VIDQDTPVRAIGVNKVTNELLGLVRMKPGAIGWGLVHRGVEVLIEPFGKEETVRKYPFIAHVGQLYMIREKRKSNLKDRSGDRLSSI